MEMNTEDDVLTVREASEYLRIGVYTLYRLARTGKIPASKCKVSNAWRFEKKNLIEWISTSKFDRRLRRDRRQEDDNTIDANRRSGEDRRRRK
jgi:excisionase family DNA binding protein